MDRKVWGFLWITAFALLIWGPKTYAQTTEPPRAGAPMPPSSPLLEGPVPPPHLPTPPTPALTNAGPVLLAPAAKPVAPYQDNNGPLLSGDPLLDSPNAPPPGWFGAVDIDFLGPHIKNRLRAPVTVPGSDPRTVHLPTAELDWVGSPRFEVGYRWPEGLGEVLLSYRFLVSEGTNPDFSFVDPGDAFLKSRLNVNVVDLDYSSREFSLAPHWDMKWKVGARLATAFFDSRANSFFMEQRTSNNFVGAGPHVGLDLWRAFDLVPGLGFFGRVESAAVIGEISQAFEQVAITAPGLVGGATTIHHTQAVPVFTLQAGLSWLPTWSEHWRRFAFGYQFERWWYLGEAADSRAELTTHGIFCRAEFAF